VCESTELPILKFFSATDASDPFLGIRCFKVEKTVKGISLRDLLSAQKVARLIDGLFP
jgi:hypothetical protein